MQDCKTKQLPWDSLDVRLLLLEVILTRWGFSLLKLKYSTYLFISGHNLGAGKLSSMSKYYNHDLPSVSLSGQVLLRPIFCSRKRPLCSALAYVIRQPVLCMHIQDCLWITPHAYTPSKSAPFPPQYDEPGKSYARLIELAGCRPGPDSVGCLVDVPFEVCDSSW